MHALISISMNSKTMQGTLEAWLIEKYVVFHFVLEQAQHIMISLCRSMRRKELEQKQLAGREKRVSIEKSTEKRDKKILGGTIRWFLKYFCTSDLMGLFLRISKN